MSFSDGHVTFDVICKQYIHKHDSEVTLNVRSVKFSIILCNVLLKHSKDQNVLLDL